MSPAERAESIAGYLEECVAAGHFPGAVAVVRERGREVASVAAGDAVVVPERIPATVETVFDLASLTKQLVTALLFCQAMESGDIAMDTPVLSVLPEFDRDDKRAMRFRDLLTHTSGLPKWAPLYATAREPERVLEAIASLNLAYVPGSRVVYSDPGFLALGFAIERIGGASLDRLFAGRIAAPLGLRTAGFCPDQALRPRIAASETGNVYERELAGDAAATYRKWRTDVIWGEVHDGNAFFLGGVAGHAGLFGTAGEAALIAEQFLPGSTLLSEPTTFAMVRENLTPGLEEHRSLGWILGSTPECSAGPAMPADAFGHTGFTGTSVWVDPQAERVVALMTNRTHPVYAAPPMTGIRRTVNALAAS